MKTKIVFAGIAAALLTTVGCLPSTKSGRGFQMPTGNAENGKIAFVQLKCNECHRVNGVTLPAPATPASTIVQLGGEVSRLRTYGELVTSIIHPTRTRSKVVTEPFDPAPKLEMKDVNREMTVAQLLDIVTFLEPTYKRATPGYIGNSL